MSGFEELMKKKAVALKYDAQKNGAPVIVASGMGYMAEKITEAAMEQGSLYTRMIPLPRS